MIGIRTISSNTESTKNLHNKFQMISLGSLLSLEYRVFGLNLRRKGTTPNFSYEQNTVKSKKKGNYVSTVIENKSNEKIYFKTFRVDNVYK